MGRPRLRTTTPEEGREPGLRPGWPGRKRTAFGYSREFAEFGKGRGLTSGITMIKINIGEQVRLKAGPQMLVSERTGIPSPADFFCLTTAPLSFGQVYLQQYR